MSKKELMDAILNEFIQRVDGVIKASVVIYPENIIYASNCNPYGCTCIAYEKCCGCFLQ